MAGRERPAQLEAQERWDRMQDELFWGGVDALHAAAVTFGEEHPRLLGELRSALRALG